MEDEEFTTIRITKRNHNRLTSLGKWGEEINDILDRVLKEVEK
jgi:hypothetical protein